MKTLDSIFKSIFTAICFLMITFQQTWANTYTVTNTTDAAANSLRDCINQANAIAGPHTIKFSVTGTITLASNLPIFQQVIFVDGTTAPGYTGYWTPLIYISGFTVNINNAASAGSHFKGLGFVNCNPHGFVIQGVNNTIIEDCLIGTNGTVAMGAAAHGILMISATGTSIRRCIVSGQAAHGILIQDSPNTIVSGCYIGTNKTGTAAIPNSAFGILLLNVSSGAKIGGLTSDSMNVISGNNQVAVGLQGTARSAIRIVGNYMGVTAAGTAALGNQFGINDGGGTTSMYIYKNVIAASSAQGIYINGGASVVIKGNYLGTDATGTTSLANLQNNIDLNGTDGTIIGGSAAGEGNVIGGSGGPGIHGIILQGSVGTNNCIIKGNYVGTNASGTAITGVGVQGCGIVIKGSNNIIGGLAAGERNIISGNKQTGIILTNSGGNGNGNQVIGNYIGVDANLASLGNGYAGILIRNENTSFQVQNDIITNNVIAYNGFSYPTNPTNSTWVLPNKGPGIGVGVAEYGTGNTLAIQHKIKDNQIYCNAGLGISLNKLETTPGYGNINKASPVINSASTNTNTFGTAAPGDEVQVFANPTNCGSCQGEILLGTVTADGAGNWSLPVHANYYLGKITATGRDASNNTSEFSVCTDPTLPVTYVSFTASHIAQDVALLTWQVATQLNNDYFTVEKSTDGINFYPIGNTIKGDGSSALTKTYTFEDDNFTSSAYYRIKQTDTDGKYTYTIIRYLALQSTNELHVYPNPAYDNVSVSLQVPNKALVSYSLMNALSQVVYTGQETVSSILFEKQLDLSTLPAGMYILTVSTATQSTSVKLIKQ